MRKTSGRQAVKFDGREVGAIYLKSNSANYYFDYRPYGQRVDQYSLGESNLIKALEKAEAEAGRRALEPRLTAGAVLPKRKLATLSDLLDAYKSHKVERGIWNKTTADSNGWVLESFLKFEGNGSKSPAIMSRDLLARWMTWHQTRRDEDGTQSNKPATSISHLATVGAFCSWLVREGYISARPDTEELAPTSKAVKKTRKKKSLSPQQIEAVAAHLAKGKQYWAEWFAVGVGVGLRPAEQAHLRASDYVSETKALHVREQEDWSPKTDGSVRRILLQTVDRAMAPEVAEILARRKAEAEKREGPDGLLFPVLPHGQGVRPRTSAWSKGGLSHALTRACKGSGVHVFPYKARHTFCRRALAAKWAPAEVKNIMGHSNLKTTEGYGLEVEPEEFVRREVLESALASD